MNLSQKMSWQQLQFLGCDSAFIVFTETEHYKECLLLILSGVCVALLNDSLATTSHQLLDVILTPGRHCQPAATNLNISEITAHYDSS